MNTTVDPLLTSALSELDDTRRRLLALCDLTAAPAPTLAVDVALERSVRDLARLLRCEAAYALVDVDGTTTVAGHPRVVDLTSALVFAARSGRPVTVADGSALGVGDGPALALPLMAEGIEGVIALVGPIAGAFDPSDYWLALTGVGHLLTMLETIRLHQRTIESTRVQAELELAATVQERLRPASSPRLAGFDVATGSTAARIVGGDLLDHVSRPDHLYLTVGDVSGKGLAAALLMAVVQLAARRWITDLPDAAPATVVAATNQETYDALVDAQMFTSMCIARLDSRDRTITYASAGQSPIVHRSRHGDAELLLPGAAPLGVTSFSAARDEILRLAPGDIALFGTDGAIDQRNREGEAFGVERLLALVDTHTGTAAQLITRIEDAVRRFGAGAPIDDDLTLAVVIATEDVA